MRHVRMLVICLVAVFAISAGNGRLHLGGARLPEAANRRCATKNVKKKKKK